MAEGKRLKNRDWVFYPDNFTGNFSNTSVGLALLMDIRDELQRINSQLACAGNTIPRDLRKIAANTTKKKNGKKKLRRVA